MSFQIKSHCPKTSEHNTNTILFIPIPVSWYRAPGPSIYRSQPTFLVHLRLLRMVQWRPIEYFLSSRHFVKVMEIERQSFWIKKRAYLRTTSFTRSSIWTFQSLSHRGSFPNEDTSATPDWYRVNLEDFLFQLPLNLPIRDFCYQETTQRNGGLDLMNPV